MEKVNYLMNDICRICENNGDLCFIFEDENKHVLKKLRSCADINIDLNDELPNGICKICVKNLDFAYKFKIQCEYTDSKLRNLLLIAKLKNENENTTNNNTNNYIEEIEYDNNIVYGNYMNVDRLLIVEDNEIDEVNEEDQNNKPNDKLPTYVLFKDDIDSNVKLKSNNDDDLNINKKISVENESRSSFEDEEIQEIDATDISIDQFELDTQSDERNASKSVSLDFSYENEEDSTDETNEETLDEIHIADEEDEVEDEEEDEGEVFLENDYESEDEIVLSKRQTKRKRIINQNRSNDLKGYVCETCGEEFKTYSDFNTHKKSHGNKRFRCSQCDKWFSKKYHLKNHEIVHTGEKRYKCNQCNKVYTNHGNLDRHIRVFHRKERLHVCDKCGKGFSQSTTLKQHYAVHIEERNFECEICHKRYKTQEYLNLHKDRHLPVAERKVKTTIVKKKKPVIKICVCTYCGKKSNSVALHQSHIRTHTGEKPYECHTCKKKFSFQQSLKSHLLLHTGEKPFKCESCGLTFRQIGHLKGHRLVHTGEKQHKCLVCEKTFALRGNLTVHMRLHTGETPYHCTVCPKKFYDSNGLKRHTSIHMKHLDSHIIKGNDEDEGEEEDGMLTSTITSAPSLRQHSIIKIIATENDENCDLDGICYDIIETDETNDLQNRQEIEQNLPYETQENNYIDISSFKKIKEEN